MAPIESEEVGATEEKLHDVESGLAEAAGDAELTDEDRTVLRKVAGSIPLISWVLCIAELAERASYYGASQVFNDYLEFPLPANGTGTGAVPADNPNGHAGAL